MITRNPRQVAGFLFGGMMGRFGYKDEWSKMIIELEKFEGNDG